MAETTAPSTRSDAVTAAAIFLLAAGLRLLHVRDIVRSGLSEFLRLDPLYYHEWAQRIARGDLLGREAFEMSPLYPYALAAVYRFIGDGLVAPRIAQALLGALTCVGTFFLGRRLSGRASGALAGTMLAVYGPAIYYDGQINKTCLALALSLGFVMAAVWSSGRRAPLIAASGALLGLTALVHENVNVIAPVLLLWVAWPREGDRPRAWLLRGIVFVAGYAAAVLPVTARNVAVSGEWVLITSGGGENFYTGNNEAASGRYGPPPFVRPDPFLEHEDFRQEAARRLGHPVTRAESSRFWWREGWRFILGNPVAYLRLLWDKFEVFSNAFERPDNFSYYDFRVFSPTLSLTLLSFGVVAPMAFLGILFTRSRWRDLIPVYAGAGAYVLSALIFFTQSRYRMPALPFLVIFAAEGALGLASLARQRRAGAFGAAAAGLIAVFLFVNQDPGNAPGFYAQNDAILGEMYFHAGRYEDAAASFRRGLEGLRPLAAHGNVVFSRIAGGASYGLGLTELKIGRESEAESALRDAAACPDPEVQKDALDSLDEIYQRRRDVAADAEVLGRLTALRPDDAPLRLRRAESLYKLGRMGESLAEVQAVLDMRPPPSALDLADASYGLAMIKIAGGEEGAALAALRRTIELNPSHPRAEWIRGKLAAAGAAPP